MAEREWIKGLSKMPKDGQRCEIRGSDFMGEWMSEATFKITSPKGPKYRWLGVGFMGPRERSLGKGDVEYWRPKQEAPDGR